MYGDRPINIEQSKTEAKITRDDIRRLERRASDTEKHIKDMQDQILKAIDLINQQQTLIEALMKGAN